MLQMDTIGVSINNFFSKDVQYKVPRYQRRYVWDKTNWDTLWEDILFQLGLELDSEKNRERVFKERTQHEDKLDLALENKDSGHFTGLLVTRPTNLDEDLDRYEVIDGQQRLTTFQIILCVIRDICRTKNYHALADEIKDLIANKPTVSQRFSDATHKFIPTNYDKSTFHAVVVGEYGAVISNAFDEEANCLMPELVNKVRAQVFDKPEKVSRRILDAYDYFYRWIRIYGKTHEYKKLDTMFYSLKTQFFFVPIQLKLSGRSEKIFESLNATGRKLSEFDYLRNHLFLRAGRLGKAPGKDDSYSDIFYDEYWHFENESHDWEVDQLEAFFRAFLVAKLGPDCFGAKKPFEVYQQYSKALTMGVEYEFRQLRDYAKSYQKMNNPASSVGLHMQFYDRLNLPCLDSLILFGEHEAKLSAIDLHSVCNILESYIVRRMLCYGDREYSYRKLNDFFSQAIEDKPKFKVDSFTRFLSNSWPSDTQVRNALQSAGSKDPNLILYILHRIECDRPGNVELEFKNLKLLHIEPQEIPDNSGQAVSWYPERDSIGNMTLCTSGPPENWHELPFEEKKETLKTQFAPDLTLTEEICTFTNWGAEAIEKRVGGFLSVFSKIWRSPQDYSV